jgi:hypothetical protein
MSMGMDETQMILALRALRELLDNGDRDDEDELVASYRTLGECASLAAALQRAEAMSRAPANTGAIAFFSRAARLWASAAR